MCLQFYFAGFDWRHSVSPKDCILDFCAGGSDDSVTYKLSSTPVWQANECLKVAVVKWQSCSNFIMVLIRKLMFTCVSFYAKVFFNDGV